MIDNIREKKLYCAVLKYHLEINKKKIEFVYEKMLLHWADRMETVMPMTYLSRVAVLPVHVLY